MGATIGSRVEIEIQDAVLAELQYAKRALTVQELADRLELSHLLIIAALHKLRNGHLVERTSDGRWKLLPSHS
jgi:GTP-sensing pleiotropic transcriptional regulator CodY